MGKRYAPRVKHIVAPRIQHHVNEAGPPRVRGVLKVVAILEQRPMMLNAKLIWMDVRRRRRQAREGDTHCSNVGELAFEGGDVANLKELVVIVGEVVAAARDGAGLSDGFLLGERVGHGGGRKERGEVGAGGQIILTRPGGSRWWWIRGYSRRVPRLLMFACRRRP